MKFSLLTAVLGAIVTFAHVLPCRADLRSEYHQRIKSKDEAAAAQDHAAALNAAIQRIEKKTRQAIVETQIQTGQEMCGDMCRYTVEVLYARMSNGGICFTTFYRHEWQNNGPVQDDVSCQ